MRAKIVAGVGMQVKLPKYAEIVTLKLGNGEEKRGQVPPARPCRPVPPLAPARLCRLATRTPCSRALVLLQAWRWRCDGGQESGVGG